jgi:hypothetical protein
MKAIPRSTLEITDVVWARAITSIVRVERGEWGVCFAVRDTETGETGLVSFYHAYDKRDVEEEEMRTDNPALFTNNLLESDWYCDGDVGSLLPRGADRKGEGDEMPYYEHRLEYDKVDGQWGFRVVS